MVYQKINNVVLADRKWFYFNSAGRVEVDSTFVLMDNRDKFGGYNAPVGTDINFVDNGDHIFTLPHELADRIKDNAGRRNTNKNPSGVVEVNVGQSFDIKYVPKLEEIKIIPENVTSNDIEYTVMVYGIDGTLKFFEKAEKADALDIPCIVYTDQIPRDRQKSRMPSSA